MTKFSFIIPIIKAKFLSQTIDSVLKQSFKDFELILYNDFSSEDIDSVVNLFRDDRIKYYRGEKNLGESDPSLAWNKAINFASGEFICLLGDDDLISENYLEQLNSIILKYPNVNIFRAKMVRIDENNNVISENTDLPEFETWIESMHARVVKKRMQSTCEFILRKSKLLEIGGYVNFPRACGSDDATYMLLAKENGIISTNKAMGYWRKSALNISDNDSKEMNDFKIKFLLEWENNLLDKSFSNNVSLSEIYKSINYILWNIDNKKRISDLEKELQSAKENISIVNLELSNIYGSREWKAFLMISKYFKIIFPQGSLQRKCLVKGWSYLKKAYRIILKVVRNIKSFFQFLGKRFRVKKTKKINFESKKLVYVGHSYHSKTKSTGFLIDYLKLFFDVQIILDDSWQGKPFPDLSFIDESYLGVIFFQSLPSYEIIKKIKNDNIIFFPMYDGVRHDYSFWSEYYDLKIINFSKTLHNKLAKWGFDTMHVQFFPKPQQFNPGRKDEVFFWQRLGKININVVEKLFKNEKVQIHLHKAIDPNEQFVQPTKEQEEEFGITYSDWFETREEMWDLIKQKGIFIAPREFEGIGMSFLEAMAMGKAIISVDNPTMNEYIINGKNGYLYNLAKVKEIDLRNIEEVQKNVYEFMCKGYEKWELEKKNIIDFIKKS